MKKTARNYRGLVLGLAIGFLVAGSSVARADVLYTNGPLNGEYSAFAIGDDGSGAVVANSFTLMNNSIVGTIDFSAWTDGGSITSVNWAIVTDPTADPFDNNATILASGTANPTGVLTLAPNSSGLNVYAQSFNTGVYLTAGDYWLELSDAEVSGDNPGAAVAYWDENDGFSTAISSVAGPLANYTCGSDCGQSGSETFDINGVTTPEPGTVTLLFSGLLFTGAARFRSKLTK